MAQDITPDDAPHPSIEEVKELTDKLSREQDPNVRAQLETEIDNIFGAPSEPHYRKLQSPMSPIDLDKLPRIDDPSIVQGPVYEQHVQPEPFTFNDERFPPFSSPHHTGPHYKGPMPSTPDDEFNAQYGTPNKRRRSPSEWIRDLGKNRRARKQAEKESQANAAMNAEPAYAPNILFDESNPAHGRPTQPPRPYDGDPTPNPILFADEPAPVAPKREYSMPPGASRRRVMRGLAAGAIITALGLGYAAWDSKSHSTHATTKPSIVSSVPSATDIGEYVHSNPAFGTSSGASVAPPLDTIVATPWSFNGKITPQDPCYTPESLLGPVSLNGDVYHVRENSRTTDAGAFAVPDSRVKDRKIITYDISKKPLRIDGSWFTQALPDEKLHIEYQGPLADAMKDGLIFAHEIKGVYGGDHFVVAKNDAGEIRASKGIRFNVDTTGANAGNLTEPVVKPRDGTRAQIPCPPMQVSEYAPSSPVVLKESGPRTVALAQKVEQQVVAPPKSEPSGVVSFDFTQIPYVQIPPFAIPSALESTQVQHSGRIVFVQNQEEAKTPIGYEDPAKLTPKAVEPLPSSNRWHQINLGLALTSVDSLSGERGRDGSWYFTGVSSEEYTGPGGVLEYRTAGEKTVGGTYKSNLFKVRTGFSSLETQGGITESGERLASDKANVAHVNLSFETKNNREFGLLKKVNLGNVETVYPNDHRGWYDSGARDQSHRHAEAFVGAWDGSLFEGLSYGLNVGLGVGDSQGGGPYEDTYATGIVELGLRHTKLNEHNRPARHIDVAIGGKLFDEKARVDNELYAQLFGSKRFEKIGISYGLRASLSDLRNPETPIGLHLAKEIKDVKQIQFTLGASW